MGKGYYYKVWFLWPSVWDKTTDMGKYSTLPSKYPIWCICTFPFENVGLARDECGAVKVDANFSEKCFDYDLNLVLKQRNQAKYNFKKKKKNIHLTYGWAGDKL